MPQPKAVRLIVVYSSRTKFNCFNLDEGDLETDRLFYLTDLNKA
jgi:hypothetical protein